MFAGAPTRRGPGVEHVKDPSGLTSGAPTAPMTSAVQPCIPAAPCGADDASISRPGNPGLISAIS
jgi:hypothetical protein